MEVEVRQKRIDEEQFLEMRKEALALWPTGKEVDLDEGVAYMKDLPESKNFLKITEKLKREGRTVCYPRAGTALVEDQISLYRKLEETGVPYIPVTTDSYTRAARVQEDRGGPGRDPQDGQEDTQRLSPDQPRGKRDEKDSRERHYRRL